MLTEGSDPPKRTESLSEAGCPHFTQSGRALFLLGQKDVGCWELCLESHPNKAKDMLSSGLVTPRMAVVFSCVSDATQAGCLQHLLCKFYGKYSQQDSG